MTQVKKCETRFRSKEVSRSAVESRAGWNYCTKHFFKSRQSFDWSLSIPKVNWSRIMTSYGKWIWVEVTLKTQNMLCTSKQDRFEQLVPTPTKGHLAALTSSELSGCLKSGTLISALYVRSPLLKNTSKEMQKGCKNQVNGNNQTTELFFFPWSPVNWNWWSLHRSN